MSLLNDKVAATDRIVNRKIREEFTLKDATLYGGYNLYSDMVARNGLDTLLEKNFCGWKAPWANYNLLTVLCILIYGYALGVKRIWHLAEIRRDALLCARLLRPAGGHGGDHARSNRNHLRVAERQAWAGSRSLGCVTI